MAALIPCRRPPGESPSHKLLCSPHQVAVTVIHDYGITERINYFFPGIVRAMKLKPEGLVICCSHNDQDAPDIIRRQENTSGHTDEPQIYGIEKNESYYWLTLEAAKLSGHSTRPACMKCICNRAQPILGNVFGGSGGSNIEPIFDFDENRFIAADERGIDEMTFFWSPRGGALKSKYHHRIWHLGCASLFDNSGFITANREKVSVHTWRKNEIQRVDHMTLKRSKTALHMTI